MATSGANLLAAARRAAVDVFALVLLLTCAIAWAQLQDPRYCGPPARYADGSIKRSSAQRAAFVQMHRCPSTGEVSGSCPGWGVDHIVPLSCGGCDVPSNMQWLPLTIKSCAGTECKDRWERRVYMTDLPC